MITDLIALGVPEIEARRTAATRVPPPVAVRPSVRPAVLLFLALGTQWRFAEGIPTGLDYPAVPVVAPLVPVTLTPGLFGDLRVLEAEALRTWAARRSHDRHPSSKASR